MTAIEELHKLLHGEKGTSAVISAEDRQADSYFLVAFGTICQLVLDGVPTSELDRYIEFMLSVDLPVTFEMLGIPDVSDEQLREVAKLACSPMETIWNLERAINEDIVFNAIKGANAASISYIKRSGRQKQ